ncbi:T9SS type A sorting domain-containing protein, partial [Bacteroidia bacterium]|nr:T9SS type A sorting domain-containing protein [Bacteroidia bacterium]
RSGSSTAISDNGTRVAIGARLNDGGGSNFGHVRVYEYSSGSWSQLGSDIDGEAINDFSGESVSLSGDGSIVAISALSNDGNGTDAGHVRVYQYSSGSWSQLGSDIDGEAAYDKSGTAVSLSNNGSVVAIGAYYNDGNGSSSGHVRVYEYSSGSWSQLGSDIDGEAANDQSGKSVSLSRDGTKVAIGAIRNDGNGNDAGHVRVYQYSSGSWSQLGSDIDGEAAGDYLGAAVSLSDDGTILAVGAIYNDGTGTNAGQARIYNYSGSSWSQLGADIDGEAAGDFFGKAVSLSGDGTKLAVGANRNGGNGTYAGSVRTYNISASLPVDLIHFDVQTRNNHSSSLHWATASEINNSHFEIERSYDGKTFEMIDQVSGNGNSQHLIRYSYTDQAISPTENNVFYRLKQVDFDGAFEYSDIRVVRFEGNHLNLVAYPNPITDDLTLTVGLSQGENYNIQAVDMQGTRVFEENYTFTNGIHRINTAQWTSGMYILKVASEQGSEHIKVMKK